MASRTSASTNVSGDKEDDVPDDEEGDDEETGRGEGNGKGEKSAATLEADNKVYVTPPPSSYGTWVSEIMLQQTRVETVIPYWYRWMEKFPTLTALANATPDDVNASWAGLGYYRRAQQLLKAAKQVVSTTPEGDVPQLPHSAKELLSVPGIGPYTAGAISSIAHSQVEPLVDGNVMRVFSRLRMLTCELSSKEMEKEAWCMAAVLVDPTSPGDFNQSLMELGATVCKPTSPRCGECPVREICQAHMLTSSSTSLSAAGAGGGAVEVQQGSDEMVVVDRTTTSISTFKATASCTLGENGLPVDVTYFPIKAPKKKAREVILSVAVFVEETSGEFLFVRRPAEGLLQSQWEFPNVVLWEEPSAAEQAKVKSLGKAKDKDKAAAKKTATKATKPGKGTKGKVIWRPTAEKEAAEAAAATLASTSTTEAMLVSKISTTSVTLTAATSVYAKKEDVLTSPASVLLATVPDFLLHSTGCIWRSLSQDTDADADADDEEDEDAPHVLRSTTFESGYRSVEPIVHVFSHQRHTMHITVIPVSVSGSLPTGTGTAGMHREVRWMSEQAIGVEGITTGCKKILNAVQKVLKKSKIHHSLQSEEKEKQPRVKKEKKTKESASDSTVGTVGCSSPAGKAAKTPKMPTAAVQAAIKDTPAISSFFTKKTPGEVVAPASTQAREIGWSSFI